MEVAFCLASVIISTILAPTQEPRHDEILTLQPGPIRKACQESGMWMPWHVGRAKNETRIFWARIVFNQVTEVDAAFREDGSLIKEKSSPTPVAPESKPRRSPRTVSP